MLVKTCSTSGIARRSASIRRAMASDWASEEPGGVSTTTSNSDMSSATMKSALSPRAR